MAINTIIMSTMNAFGPMEASMIRGAGFKQWKVDHRGELTRVNAEVPKLLIQIKLRIARCALMAFDMRRVT